MFGHACPPAAAAGLPGWSLLFAREPEPDPDLDDLPDRTVERTRPGVSPLKPQKTPSRRPIILLLLLLVVATVVYLSLNMDKLSDTLPESITDLLGEAPSPPPPPAPDEAPGSPGSLTSKTAPDTPMAPPSAMEPSMSSEPPSPSVPASPMEPASSSKPPFDLPPPAPAPSLDLKAETAPDMKREMKPAMTDALSRSTIPPPRFGEGQRVSLAPDPAAPTRAMSLSGDASGTRPGPTLHPGAVVTVLDGELVDNAWVYSVRTQDGAKGWIPENRLMANP